MASRAGPNPSPEPPRDPAAGRARLPWSRSEAFRFWMVAVATTALLETAVVALFAALLPMLFLSLARFTEKKYQRRPTKAFQVSQFGLYLVGTALVSAGFLRH